MSVALAASDVATTLAASSSPADGLAAAAVDDVHTDAAVADRPSLALALRLPLALDDDAPDDTIVTLVEPVLAALLAVTLLACSPGPA